MPWRLIVFIIVFAIALTFITFNLGNRCDINFGFIGFKDVPVFLTAFISFFLGMLCILPFVAGAKIKRKEKIAVDDTGKKNEDSIEKKRRDFKARHRKTGKDDADPKDGAFSDGGPYGID